MFGTYAHMRLSLGERHRAGGIVYTLLGLIPQKGLACVECDLDFQRNECLHVRDTEELNHRELGDLRTWERRANQVVQGEIKTSKIR